MPNVWSLKEFINALYKLWNEKLDFFCEPVLKKSIPPIYVYKNINNLNFLFFANMHFTISVLMNKNEMDKREEKILKRIHLNSVYVAPLSRLLRSSVKRKTSYTLRLYNIFLKFFLSFFPRRNANRLHRTLSKHFINYKIIFR